MTKRYLIAAAAHNLGRILRRLTGMGKPKALQGAATGLGGLAAAVSARLRSTWARFVIGFARLPAAVRRFGRTSALPLAV